MRKLIWFLMALCVAVGVPTAAQETSTVVQLAVPFFLEDILEPVIEQYNADNPGVLAVLSPYQGFGIPVDDSDDPAAYLDSLEEYFSSADVLLVDSSLPPAATRAGFVLDLSPLTGSDPAFNEADFQPALLPSFEWDGGQWALPISSSFVVLTYIPQAFDDVGLTYPSENWTLADLEFAARELTQYNADGTTAVPGLVIAGGPGGGNTLAALLISLLGRGLYDAGYPANPDFSSTELETLLSTWQQMQADGLLTVPEGVNPNTVPMSIGNPQTFGGGPFGGQQNQPERATTLLPGGRAGLNTNGLAVSAGTANPEAAYHLAKYLLHNRNAVAASFGTVSAVINLDEAPETEPGPGGFGGPGGFLANALSVPEDFQPLLDSALQQGLTPAELRFSDGILSAWDLMQSDEALDPRTALDEAQVQINERLGAADSRYGETRITVQEPDLPPTLTPGEIALNFAVLGGGPGFVVEQEWQGIADQFAANDAEVGFVQTGSENQNDLATIASDYDCFYASSNLVPDADLSQLLSLDPLLSADPNFDPGDFVSGVFDQVQVNNQTFALPIQISPLVLRFDYDIFNRAGVMPSAGSWTVADFEDTLRQIKPVMADDETVLTLNVSGPTALLTLIAVYGGLPFDTRTSPPTINFTDPATMDAMQQVLDLVKGGYITYSQGGGPGGGGGGGNTNGLPLYSNVLNAFAFGGFGGGPGGGGQQNTDGVVTFPVGTQINAVPYNLGTAYISATSQHVEACYRFLMFLSDTADLFQAMPARRSEINSPELLTARGDETVAFFNSLADLMEQPGTLQLPTNINAGNFGMTNWLLGVFDRYLADEVVDLPSDLAQAQQITQDYLTCVDALPAFDPSQGDFQSFFQQINECQTLADPSTASS